MKFSNIVAMAFGATFIAAPIYAGAAQEGGTICGRVNAPSSYILQLEQSPTHDNIIDARSQSEDVQAHVNVDGTYCFTNLHGDVHTITAFEDAFPTLRATVTPIPGQTLILDLTGLSVDL
jgi:hypothetical protein